jgi:hypothetical protein
MDLSQWVSWWPFVAASLLGCSGPGAPAAVVAATTAPALGAPVSGDALSERCYAHRPVPRDAFVEMGDPNWNRCALAVTGDVSLEGHDCALAARTAPTPELRVWYEAAARDCDCMEQRDWVASGLKLEPWQICR